MPVYHRRHEAHDANGPHASQNFPEADLEILRGAARERVRTIVGPAFLIGTAHDCDLVLGDSQFPSVHSCLLLGPYGVSIRHLGFDPELLVNDRPIDCVPLANGDRITIGRYEFRIHIREKTPHETGSRTGQPVATSVTSRPKGASDNLAKAQIRSLLAEIRQMETTNRPTETPPSTQLKLYVGIDLPTAPLAKRIRRA